MPANILEKKKLKKELEYLRKIGCESFEREIIGESAVMKDLMNKVEKIAEAGVSTILITGESGTGKELMARYIHRLLYGDCPSELLPL